MLSRLPIRSAWPWVAALVLYWLALFVATHLPGDTPMLPTDSTDKVIHAVAYAVLAALVALAWYATGRPIRWTYLLAAGLVIVLYGALDEWTQIPVGRDGSVGDWVADVVGTAIGLALAALLLRQPPP